MIWEHIPSFGGTYLKEILNKHPYGPFVGPLLLLQLNCCLSQNFADLHAERMHRSTGALAKPSKPCKPFCRRANMFVGAHSVDVIHVEKHPK